MDIKTREMGVVSVDEKQMVNFSKGLFGFESFHSFALIDAIQKPFIWLQSAEDEHLAFLLINPFLFRSDYELDLAPTDSNDIALDDSCDALIYAIVTVSNEDSSVTANLQGPVVINRRNGKGVQAVLSDTRWHTKHDIIAEMNRRKG